MKIETTRKVLMPSQIQPGMKSRIAIGDRYEKEVAANREADAKYR